MEKNTDEASTLSIMFDINFKGVFSFVYKIRLPHFALQIIPKEK